MRVEREREMEVEIRERVCRWFSVITQRESQSEGGGLTGGRG